MLYIRKLEEIIFYLAVFSVSIQLGKHFFPPFSLVQGIRVDYLSPTLYLSDIFVFLLFGYTILFNLKKLFNFLSKTFILPLFLISVLISSFFANSQQSAFVWSLKIVEMIFFGWYVSEFNFTKERIFRLTEVLIAAGFIQALIAVGQLVLQRSIGGPLYFLGERTFNVDTIGIATFFSMGREILRPYGTFPHPNVLAFFLSITVLLGAFYFVSRKNLKRSYFYIISLSVIFLGLLATASRLIIILTVILIFLQFFKSKKLLIYLTICLLILIPFYIMLFSGRFLTLDTLFDSVRIRIELFSVNLKILSENFLFGVGPNNTFFSSLNNTLPIYVRFQPTHNIYLHSIVQIGIVGAIPVFVFLFALVKRAVLVIAQRKSLSRLIGLIVIEFLIVGLVDHFPITLQQGMLMSALSIGLLYNSNISKELV